MCEGLDSDQLVIQPLDPPWRHQGAPGGANNAVVPFVKLKRAKFNLFIIDPGGSNYLLKKMDNGLNRTTRWKNNRSWASRTEPRIFIQEAYLTWNIFIDTEMYFKVFMKRKSVQEED
jgi:hypothetical protein